MKKLLILWLVIFSSVLFAQNVKQSVKELETECDLNNAYSCVELSLKYHYGEDDLENKLSKIFEELEIDIFNNEISLTLLAGNNELPLINVLIQ